MHGLKLAGVDMNRKMLADVAYNDAETFAQLAENKDWAPSQHAQHYY